MNKNNILKTMFISLSILIGFASCHRKKGLEVNLCTVFDTKYYADSIAKLEGCKNPRTMRLGFEVLNCTDEDYYMPIHTWYDFEDTIYSHIDVTISNGNDTIRPKYYIKTATLNGNILPAHDSLYIWVHLDSFSDWQTDFCNLNHSPEQVAMMTNIKYVYDERDKNEKQMKIPQVSYRSSLDHAFFFVREAGREYEEP